MEKTATPLRMDRILEYYDVPQLFVARDAFDTLYLCLLYDDEDVCRYTGIRISLGRLRSFTQGAADLRSLYVSPEKRTEYYDVECDDGSYWLSPSSLQALPEGRLPAEGYTFRADDSESIVVNIPNNDKPLFRELVRKFGWVCM